MNLLESFQSNQEWLSIQQIAFVERKDYMKLFFSFVAPVRLDFPHSNSALIMILFMLLFLASRAPHDIYEQMKMFSVEYGERVDIMHRVMCRPIARSSAAREASDAGSCGETPTMTSKTKRKWINLPKKIFMIQEIP